MIDERARVVAAVFAALALATTCTVYDSSVFASKAESGGASGMAGSAGTGSAGVDASAGTVGGGGGEPAAGAAGEGAAGSEVGGSSGKAGSSGHSVPIFNGNLELIDDFDDGDYYIYLLGTDRDGKWWLGFDGTSGTTEPNPFLPDDAGGYDGSAAAAHLQISGYTGWGANAGFNFMHETPPNSWPMAYDASSYCGVAFWAKRSETSAAAIDVRISDSNTDPAGGICSQEVEAGTDDAGTPLGCWDHYGKQVTLLPEWTYHEVLFSEMTQDYWGYGSDAGLTADELYHLEITVGANLTFEIWIDDIAFVLREDGGSCP